MKNSILILFALCLFGTANAQKYCGFDHFRNTLKEKQRISETDEIRVNDAILQSWEQRASRAGGIITIPIVVHVIHNGGEENISDEQILAGINHLNDAYSNSGEYTDADGIDMGIQFCLAKRDPEGEFSSGINRVQNTLTDMLVPSDDEDLKSLIQWDTEEYLNFWIVKSITREENNTGTAGYSSFPDSHGQEDDGIVCEAEHWGASIQTSKLHIHETGHYLGLYHTFQEGCPNDDCMMSGDRVCDTPPDALTFTQFCFDPQNSCLTDEDDTSLNNPFRPIAEGGLGDQNDMVDNYMDYSSWVCYRRFTPGQRERMIAAIETIRFSLLDGDQCVPPCTSPIEIDVFVDGTMVNVGDTVTLVNNSTNYTDAEWTILGLSYGSESTLDVVFDFQGDYDIELLLENDQPGCAVIDISSIQVTCPIDAVILADAYSIPTGGSVTFQNLSEGATSYSWEVNGEEVSQDEELDYIFPEPGLYAVQLLASDSLCTVESNIEFISAGSCTSGKEHNIWHLGLTGGEGTGLDWNNNEPALFSETTIGYSESKSTMCDMYGDLLMCTNGMQIWDKNYDVMMNGDSLTGNFSSRSGSIIVKKPGSDHQYYVIYTDSDEQDFAGGLRYSVVDMTLNGGLGDVTDEKNVLIENVNQETFCIIRHCNLKDLWLVTYKVPGFKFHAWKITEDGFADEPVESPYLVSSANLYLKEFKASPQGDRLFFGKHLFEFSQSTGDVQLYLEFDDDPLYYEFSPSGKVLYNVITESVDLKIKQFDLTLPYEEILTDTYEIDLDDFADIPSGLNAAPNGRIYLGEFQSGWLSVFNNPNVVGAGCLYTDNVLQIDGEPLFNGFGNYFHGYIAQEVLFIDGPEYVCENQTPTYTVFNPGCLSGSVNWEVAGPATVQSYSNGSAQVFFEGTGEVTLTASMETDCGIIMESKTITIDESIGYSFGPDMNMCANDQIPLTPGPGYDTYEWQNGSTNQSFNANSPGTYYCNVTLGGCSATDTIQFPTIFVGNIDLGDDFDMCDGEVVVLDIGPYWFNPVWQDGSTGNTFTVFEGGTYSVTTTLPCEASDEIYVDWCDQSNVGIEEADETAIGFNIYPNPNHGNFVITLNLEKSIGNLEIDIYDVTGALVWNAKQNVGSSSFTKSFEEEGFANGYYLVSITSDHYSASERFIVNSEK